MSRRGVESLATLCRSGRIARLQILERTLPDSGSGLAQWWQEHGTDDGSWTARVYRELIGRAGPAAKATPPPSLSPWT